MGRNRTKHLTYVTLLSAMAIVINICESMYIPTMPFGIRFGLANIIALVTIECFSIKDMIVVNAMRVFVGNLLRGMLFSSTFWISFGGVALSSLLLIISKRLLKLPLMSSSMLSAIAHSTGQVLVVMFLYKQVGMVTVLPYLFISGIPTGIITGYVAMHAIKRLKKNVSFS